MSVKSSTPLVVKHNALVNARFNFTALEMQLFVAMLMRINRTESSFQVCRIPVRELSPDSISKNLYSDVDAMTKNMATRALHLEVLGPDGKRVKNPDKRNCPLMARCDYISSQRLVEARFNDDLADDLLDLRTQFTQAQVEQLLRIRSPAAHRIYWLVKEHARQGETEREIELQELRDVLGLTTEYQGRFDHFRVRVLERAQQELAKTDVPITLEYVRQHKQVRRIRFLFPGAAPELPSGTQSMVGA